MRDMNIDLYATYKYYHVLPHIYNFLDINSYTFYILSDFLFSKSQSDGFVSNLREFNPRA